VIRVGIPRGLLYYQYGQQWEYFLRELGAEVVVSEPTSKITLDCGSCLDEVCLPAKVFFGHVCYLCPQADYLFVPRVVSTAKGQYTCPKIIGMPDMLRSNLGQLPPLIDVPINMREQRHQLLRAVIEIGRMLNKGAMASLRAWQQAWRVKSLKPEPPAVYSIQPRVGLIAHPYVIYDEQVSMGVLGKLSRLGVSVITPDMVDEYEINRALKTLNKKIFWSNSQYMAGAALALLQDVHPVDGLIFMTTFACGPDALIGELIGQYAQIYQVPCMLLSLDEHTAEAGLITRLEAFIDMLERRLRV